MHGTNVAYMVGQIFGFFLISFLLIMGCVKLYRISKRETANTKCIHSLMLVLMAFLVFLVATSLKKILGIKLIGIIVPITIIGVIILIIAAIFAIIGLMQYKKMQSTQGRTHAVIALILVLGVLSINLVGGLGIVEKKGDANRALALGDQYFNNSDYEKALSYYLEADKLFPENSIFKIKIVRTYMIMGEYERAVYHLQDGLKVTQKIQGQESPNVPAIYHNLAAAYFNMGNYYKAIESQKKCLEMSLKIFGKDHPNTKTAEKNLEILKKKKKEDE